MALVVRRWARLQRRLLSYARRLPTNALHDADAPQCVPAEGARLGAKSSGDIEARSTVLLCGEESAAQCKALNGNDSLLSFALCARIAYPTRQCERECRHSALGEDPRKSLATSWYFWCSSSTEPNDSGSQMGGTEEIASRLVVARGNSAVLLEPGEGIWGCAVHPPWRGPGISGTSPMAGTPSGVLSTKSAQALAMLASRSAGKSSTARL